MESVLLAEFEGGSVASYVSTRLTSTFLGNAEARIT
jgi:hypothetical protein